MHKLFRIAIILAWTTALPAVFAVSPAHAGKLKFVFVYNTAGELLSPMNASQQCPDPEGGNGPAAECKGVLVDNQGEYSLRLSSKDLDETVSLVLVANEYEYLPAATSDLITQDTYILLGTKRRIEAIAKDRVNHGVDINWLSEATVEAIENVLQIPRGKKGSVTKSLAATAAEIDADELNAGMGNSRGENHAAKGDKKKQHEYNLITVHQEELAEEDAAILISLAETALENEDNEVVQDYIRNNVRQALLQPELWSEVADRVFSHIAAIKAAGTDGAVIMLDADKYLVYVDETAGLSTDRSLNPEQFFAYSWHGVESDTAAAAFNRSRTGSYLVCVSGEIDNENDSSTDCVRLLVKDYVEAIARAGERRVSQGALITLSGALSVGAKEYGWSGPGLFVDAAAEETLWTAPNLSGHYEITLTVNREQTDTVSIEVYDILPVAIAEADKYVVYLDNGQAGVTLTSGSISTDGSPVDALEWSVIEYPDGANHALSNSVQTASYFTTDTVGEYTIRLVADRKGHSDETTLGIQVREYGVPLAVAGPDKITFRDQPVELNGSRSYAPEGSVLSFYWSAAGGGLTRENEPIAGFSSSVLGDFKVTLRVSDANSNSTANSTDSVVVSVQNRAPYASDDLLATYLQKVLEGQLRGYDGDADTLSYQLVGEPKNGGVTIDTNTGSFVYLASGKKGCRYKPYAGPADNEQGGLDVPVIKLCADKYQVAPGEVVILTTSHSINASKFSGYYWINATGDEQDIRKATFSSTDVGLHQVCVVGNIGQSNNTSTACVDILVTGEPGNGGDDDIGECAYVDSFTFKVSDGIEDSNTATITLTADCENTPPVAQDTSLVTAEDIPVVGVLEASDIDLQYLTYILEENGTLGKVEITDPLAGTFTYTPSKDANGTDRFTFKVSDGFQYSNIASVNVTITPVNDVPVAYFTGVLETKEDTVAYGTFGAIDPDGDVLDFRLVTQGKFGDIVVTDVRTGAFRYTPHHDANGGDVFHFVVHDGTLESNVAEVHIAIELGNDAPVAYDIGPLETYANQSIDAVLDASDVDLDALVYQITSRPAKGTVQLVDTATGIFRYTPNGTELGADSFTFTASDGPLSSNAATVTINILNNNQAPTANSQVIAVFEGVAYDGILTGSDPDGDRLSYSIVENPRLGTVVITDTDTGAYVYTPGANGTELGADSFTFTASDGPLSSNAATVTVNILNNNQAPTANSQVIAVFERVAYGGILTGSDPDGDRLSYSITENPRLGTVVITDTDTGAYVYTPGANAVGDDYFVFKASDGDMQSEAATVLVAINSTQSLCQGPGNKRIDEDGDGYADFVEQACGTDSGNPLQTPQGMLAEQYGVSFIDDDDGDGYSDIAELWLGTDHRDAGSMPSQSTLKGLPDCLSPLWDSSAPALKAFHILTPTVDAGSGDAVARFALTVIDNATGVKDISVRLVSPSGAEIQGAITITATNEGNPVVLYTEFPSDTFSRYAEPGTWTVSELKITDVAGHILQLSTGDLETNGYDSTLTVINQVTDFEAPILLDFEVLTKVVDLNGANLAASFLGTVTDSVSGVARISVTLRSPSGGAFRWGEFVTSDRPKSLTATINTNIFEQFSETGIWQVAELSIMDEAGNTLSLDMAALIKRALPTDVEVINSTPLPGTTLEYFQVLTPEVWPVFGNARASFLATACNTAAGVKEITVSLQGPSGQIMQGSYASLDTPTCLSPQLDTEVFLCGAEPGVWQVSALNVFDGAGNGVAWPAQDLLDLGYDITVIVRACGGIGSNAPPVAEDGYINTDEDTPVDGVLRATDPNGDALTYHIIANGSLGSAVITDAATGAYVYTPNANVFGNDSFTFIADDGRLESNIATISVVINPVADATLVEDISIIVIENNPYYGNLPATDADGEPLTFTIVDNGGLGTATITGQTVGAFSYVPNPDIVGADQFTYRVQDGRVQDHNSISDLATVSVTIIPEFELIDFQVLTPVISGYDRYVTITSALTFSREIVSISEVRVSLSGPSGQIVGFAGKVPLNGSYPILLSRTIDTASEPLEIGTWTFYNVLVKKQGEYFSKQVVDDIAAAGFPNTLEVIANASPVAEDLALQASLDKPREGFLIAVDPDGDKLTYRIIDNGAKGTATIVDAATGIFVYTPRAIGVDSFTFVVSDGVFASNIATVTITIDNDSVPVAYDSTMIVAENIAYIGQLLAADAEGDPLVYTVVAGAKFGSVDITNAATGDFVYRPHADFAGYDDFSFKVNDGSNDSNIATVNVRMGNKPPTADPDSITVFQNITYNGTLSGSDPEGAALTYKLIGNGVFGAVSINSATGDYTYTSLPGVLGQDSFSFAVSDGIDDSAIVSVMVSIISVEQACGTGGIVSGMDTDGDGWADPVEIAFGTLIDDASSTPADLSIQDLGISFSDDDDSDGYRDYIEVWLGSDPYDVSSVPQHYLAACFNPMSDGIKPRLLGFAVRTPQIDVGVGDGKVSYALTLLDNASGIKRARVSLLSPSGVFVTASQSFDDYPLLRGFQMDTVALTQFAEQGIWQVTGITLYDEAGNRLHITTAELIEAGFTTEVVVTNANSDATPPVLEDFTILTPDVYPGTGAGHMSFSVSVSDAASGVGSIRIDIMSASGLTVSAAGTLVDRPAMATVQLDTPDLSEHGEQGLWTVYGLLLVDGAGNSIQLGGELEQMGYATQLHITNPYSDAQAPVLESFSILTPEVYPLAGDARMSFAVTASDDISGIEQIRIDLRGPSGQYLTARGSFSGEYPLVTTAQVDTSVLSNMLEEGAWVVEVIEIFDQAGNGSTVYNDEFNEYGYSDTVWVRYD